jgi:hypothetical protein
MLHDLVEDPDEQRDVSTERPVTLRYLRGLLGLALAESSGTHTATRARRRAARHRPEATTVDRELADQLRALGYVH